MGKKHFKTVFVLSLVLILGFCLTNTAFAADKKLWRLQSVWTTNSAHHSLLIKMAKNVYDRSGGRLDIKVFGPGEIVPSAPECMDAIRNGVVEMASTTGIYSSAKIKEGLVEFGLPFGLETPAQAKEFWYEYKGGENFRLVQEAYRDAGLELLYIAPGLSYGYITTFPVNTLADFKGKKIRSFGFFGAVVAMMGGKPVSLPTEDQYLALQQGTVDGTIFVYLSLETMKFKDVCKHIIMPPPLGSPTGDMICSLKEFKKLDPDVQQILYDEVKKHNEAYLAAEGPLEAELLANAASRGLTIHVLPDTEVAKLREMTSKIWDSQARKTERNGIIIANLKAFLAEKHAAAAAEKTE